MCHRASKPAMYQILYEQLLISPSTSQTVQEAAAVVNLTFSSHFLAFRVL